MSKEARAAQDAECLRAVANALTVDQGLIKFLQELAPQWGSSAGKTRPYSGLCLRENPGMRCIVRIDSRTAILLNEEMYRHDGPSRSASHLADALRHPTVDESGIRCTVPVGDIGAITICVDQYADEDGNEVAPDSPMFHHRVISIMPT